MSDETTRPDPVFVDAVDDAEEITAEEQLLLERLAQERAVKVDQRLNQNQTRSAAWQRRATTGHKVARATDEPSSR